VWYHLKVCREVSMSIRWSGLACVALITVTMIAFKQREEGVAPTKIAPSGPSVLLVADLREAQDRCICGEIIRAVRAAGKRGLAVQELTPESQSDLLKRHQVLTSPTVLILDQDGREISRYEGETKETLAALKSRLDQLVKERKGR
jgi:hypothetical protein